MKFFIAGTTVLTAVLALTVPFGGDGGPGRSTVTVADGGPTASPLPVIPRLDVSAFAAAPRVAIATNTRVVAEPSVVAASESAVPAESSSWHDVDMKTVPKSIPAVTVDGVSSVGTQSQGQSCFADPGGSVGTAPNAVSAQGVAGTTSDDLASFAYQYNAIRVANCLQPIPYSNFRYDSCMEARLFWMAESPSPNPLDAWGHSGSVRSDGVPSTGCDGNLAGGSGNTGASVAQKWWNSASHRASLYRPGSSTAGACINFAMTHGGIDEAYSFVRSAARWATC
ncbi:MAG: hypothetical protein ACRCSP_07490 [Rhodoglobus sp.]